jgi:hypothetical protein
VDQFLQREGGDGINCPLCRTYCSKTKIKPNPFLTEVMELLENISISTIEEKRADSTSNVEKLHMNDTCQEHQSPLECYCLDCKKSFVLDACSGVTGNIKYKVSKKP